MRGGEVYGVMGRDWRVRGEAERGEEKRKRKRGGEWG